MKIYIAGPMSGVEHFNFPNFHKAASQLRNAGHEVVNPAEICPDTSLGWAECMKRDIVRMLECGAIALLDGWERSRGARIEAELAKSLGLRVDLLVCYLEPVEVSA